MLRYLCLAWFFLELGCRGPFAAGSEGGVPTLKSKEELLELGKSFPYSVAFSYGGGVAGGCSAAAKRAEGPLVALQKEAAARLDLEVIVFVMLEDATFEKSLQITSCPSLVFYRQGQPIVYDGENLSLDINGEDVYTWLSRNLVSHTKVLTDDTFEHLTQASTGATTGDWFVWFYRNSCTSLVAVWEAVASRLQYSKVVAKVNIDDNPKLALRFNLTSCSSLIYFSRGKLYRYSAKVSSVHALADFADGFYKNVPSETVKPLPTPFDQFTDDVVQWLKTCDFAGGCCWTTVGVLALTAVAAFALCCRRTSASEAAAAGASKKKQ